MSTALTSPVLWFDAWACMEPAAEAGDLARFPELLFLDRFEALVPLFSIAVLCAFDALLERPALLTLGDGWHNNHHRQPGTARQGFQWWEHDLTWYALRGLAALGLVWDLHPVPARLRGERR